MRACPTMAALLLAVAALCGCGADDACPSGSVASGERCVTAVDGGVVDAGDAGPRDAGDAAVVDEGTPDAGPCGMPCTGMTLVCDEARGMCAECTAADDDACTGALPVCDTTSGSATEGECVACNVDSDCTSLAAAQCDVATHACVPCTGNAACVGRMDATVCGAGTCVECTAVDRTACGANVCDVTVRTCTTSAVESADLCEACVSDAQCQTGRVFVAMSGDTPARVLGHC